MDEGYTILCLIMTILCFFCIGGMIMGRQFILAVIFMFFGLIFGILFGIGLKNGGNK